LVKESASERFFNNKELPSDTCAVLAAHVNAFVAYSTTLYEDYYKFSVAKLIANELQIAKLKNVTPADKLNLVLIPVQVTFDTSGNVTSVKKEYLMSGVTILGGKDTTSPMRINVVYSGF